MKKMVALAASAVLLAGAAFADDGWSLRGGFFTGLTSNFDDASMTLQNTDYSNTRVRLNANYTGENAGFKSRVEFASAAQYNNTAATSLSDGEYTTKLTFGLTSASLKYAYGYADVDVASAGSLHFEGGRFYTNPIGPNFSGYGMYGQGLSVTYNTPVEGLKVAAIGYIPSTSKLTGSWGADCWKDTFFYGAGYSNDYFEFNAGFGRDGYSGAAGSLLTWVAVSPVDQFALYAETGVTELTENAAYLNAFGEIDLSLVENLGISLFYTVYADLVTPSLDQLMFETEDTYAITEVITAGVAGGLEFNGDGYAGFYVNPGVKFNLGKFSANCFYSYVSNNCSGASLVRSGSTGNNVVIDLAWYF